MPRRLQVRMTRQAISPRLAIRILSKGGLAAFVSPWGAGFAAALTADLAAFGAAFFAAFFLAAMLTILLYYGRDCCDRRGPWPRRHGPRSAAPRRSAPTATRDSGC